MFQDLTRRILGSAIDVHRELGPGLLESTYRVCLVHQLLIDGLDVKQEVAVPIVYKGRLLPIHEAQILTYMKLSGLKVGLVLNFNVPVLRDGIRRFVR